MPPTAGAPCPRGVPPLQEAQRPPSRFWRDWRTSFLPVLTAFPERGQLSEERTVLCRADSNNMISRGPAGYGHFPG